MGYIYMGLSGLYQFCKLRIRFVGPAHPRNIHCCACPSTSCFPSKESSGFGAFLRRKLVMVMGDGSLFRALLEPQLAGHF